MPVIDGVFVPRSPLTPAELHVDYLAHNRYILERRVLVERAAAAKARRIVQVAQQLGDIAAAHDQLADTLHRALDATARAGARQARDELARLRANGPVTAAANPPAPGTLAGILRGGLDSVSSYLRTLAVDVTEDVVAAVMAALRTHGGDPTLAQAFARRDASRRLHNGVLQVVGVALNLGRTAGAQSLDVPPTFALRSEQLDKATCEPCDLLHGRIVRFGTPEYFAIMPPIGCLGGGRCRGLYVFGDGPRQMHMPEQLAA